VSAGETLGRIDAELEAWERDGDAARWRPDGDGPDALDNSSTYEGPAEVIDGDTTIPVRVEFQSRTCTDPMFPALREWDGRLYLDGGDVAALFERREVLLRMPDGREATVIACQFTEGDAFVEVMGVREAPWDTERLS
jgi:hypothetical protein